MFTLITGTPGAGKSLKAIELILEVVKKNKRDDEHDPTPVTTIYSNIAGLKIEGVKPLPEDWRECESPAMWVLDEAQYRFPATGRRGLDEDPIVSEIATHRHYGIDLVMITQHPQLISSHVRKFVGRHYHLDRRFGSAAVTVYVADNLMNVDSGLKSNEHEAWVHPKKLFDYYESASLHINNKKLPKGLRNMIFFLGALVVFSAVMAYNSVGFFTGHSAGQAALAKQHNLKVASSDGVQSYAQTKVEENINVYAGCITSTRGCRCYLEDGTPAYQEESECRNTFENLPMNLFLKTNH